MNPSNGNVVMEDSLLCSVFLAPQHFFQHMFQIYHSVVQFDHLIASFQCKLYILQRLNS